jgi:hypothetical protein
MNVSQFEKAKPIIDKIEKAEGRLISYTHDYNDGRAIMVETRQRKMWVNDRASKKILEICIQAEEEEIANLTHSLSVI